MCGRYTLIRHNHLVEIIPNFTMPVNLRLLSRYNIAPTQEIPVIFRGGELKNCRWGLIPHWSKDEKIAYSVINARMESLREKPAYRSLLDQHRCIIPADGFYEWKKIGKSKTPMYITLKPNALFGFAALYDRWRDKANNDILSCTIITTPANSLVAPIHDRMPAILAPTDFPTWLDSPTETALQLLKPFPSDQMQIHPVSSRVNTPKLDTPDLITPAPETNTLF